MAKENVTGSAITITSYFSKFWRRQIQEVKTGGWLAFSRKVLSITKLLAGKAWLMFELAVSLPLVLLIAAIRPLVLLRFGTMLSDRIGHFSGNVEAYLCEQDIYKQSHPTIDIIGCPEPVCNRQLKKMWARMITIMPGAWLWKLLDRSCQFWTRGDTHHVKLDGIASYRLFLSTQPHLSFTEEEELRGGELMAQLGIPADKSFICLHNRDSEYLNKALGGSWAYHDYRDFSVQDMVLAAEELTRRGYYVLRMGSIVAEALVSINPKIIDYAMNSLRSDFADIYLMAKSIAYFGGDSGINTVPTIFRKPIFYINFSPGLVYIVLTHYCPWPFIMKRPLHRETQRLLSLREMLEAGLTGACTSQQFEDAGVELVSNTPEEIRDLAVEVDERLKGRWQPQPEDEELQQRFCDIFRQYTPPDLRGDVQVRIGASFLRKHIYLLD